MVKVIRSGKASGEVIRERVARQARLAGKSRPEDYHPGQNTFVGKVQRITHALVAGQDRY